MIKTYPKEMATVIEATQIFATGDTDLRGQSGGEMKLVNTEQVMAIKNPDTSVCQVSLHSFPGCGDGVVDGSAESRHRNGQLRQVFLHGFHLITQ